MDLSLNIIKEENSFIVINKPAHIIVNRADTNKNVTTIQAWSENKLGIKASEVVSTDSEFVRRGGIVHRLDKETSGCMIIAKNEESFRNLQGQFKNSQVSKTYLFLAHGRISPEEGVINVPIGRLPWNRMRFGIIPQGREALTSYKVIEYKKLKNNKKEETLTLAEAYPATGRTHQIRVHMQYIGYPIFSDSLYAGRKNIKSDRKLLGRHFLHASKISFNDPESGKHCVFEAPLPPELVDFLAKLD